LQTIFKFGSKDLLECEQRHAIIALDVLGPVLRIKSIEYIGLIDVRSKDVTAVGMNGTAFWDFRRWNLVEVYICFRGAYCFHFQYLKLSQGSSKQSSGSVCILTGVGSLANIHLDTQH
jgi:hypothetical protein